MTRISSAALHALRDVVCVLATALVAGTCLAYWILRTDATWQHWIRSGLVTASGTAMTMGWDWVRAIALPVLAVWWAARARARLRTRRLAGTTAAALVLICTVVAVLPWPHGRTTGFWPGPVDPFVVPTDGSWALASTPAWGYPVLTALALVGTAALGRRAGTGPQPRSTGTLGPLPSGGRLLTVTVVGVPAALALAGALTAVGTGSGWLVGDASLLDLVVALAAAALLSGTGPSGAVVTVLCAAPVAVRPVLSWLAGGTDVLLLQAVAGTVACLVVAAWRPCAVWAAGTVGSAGPPPKTRTEADQPV